MNSFSRWTDALLHISHQGRAKRHRGYAPQSISLKNLRASRSTERGFTLVELLVVLVILVLLASVVGPRVLGYLGASRTKTAKIQIEALSASLELYKLDNGTYPTTSEGLAALVQQPTGKATWNGPYLKKTTVPLDPWGVAYHFRSPGKHAEFDLFTFGADKKEGGDGDNADVVSW